MRTRNLTAMLTIIVLMIGGGSVPALAAKTLTRTEDFVVLSGQQVKELWGQNLADLRLFACQGEACKPVPVQTDKVDNLGRYVFPSDKNPKRDGAQLDQNDEISFMASDAGDRRPAGFPPRTAKAGVEIELRDPLDNGLGWVYLVSEPGTKPPVVPDYVSYRVEGNQVLIESPQLALGYLKGRINYDLLRMTTPAGKLGPDVLDRQRVGLEAKMAGDRDIALSVPESILEARDIGVIDGPVRVILDQVVLVHLADLSFKWSTEYFLRYYRCGQNNSVHWHMPTSIKSLFKTVAFYWSLDFTPRIIGSSYYDANHPKPLPVKDQVQNGVPNDSAHFWWGLVGPEGAVLQALNLDRDIIPYFTCDGLWRQDPKAKDKNGDFPGRLELGFSCHEKGKMPEKKDYHWLNYILVPANASPAGLNSLKNIFENPLQVKVNPLS